MTRFKVGDIFLEDRSKWIGTSHEYPCDKEYPVVRMEVKGVKEHVYLLYNHTREIEAVGYIHLIDSSPETDIWVEDREID